MEYFESKRIHLFVSIQLNREPLANSTILN
jgi:hypothetical protein